LDDWRLQLLELLPAAQLQLTQAQASFRHMFSGFSPAMLSLLSMLQLLSGPTGNHHEHPFLHLCHFYIAHLNPFVTPVIRKWMCVP